jgi:hypothetical protein
MFPEKNLYSEYGEPDRVLIVPCTCKEGKNYCQATLYLIYDKNRFMSIYSLLGTLNTQTVSLCISGNSSLTMWAPGVSIGLDGQKRPEDKFIPFQPQIFNMSSKSNDIERCFNVSKDLWDK